MVNLDFLSGYSPMEGYSSCDYIYSPSLDHIFNLTDYRIEGLAPLSVSTILCRNALHHVQDLNRLVQEFLRVLQNNGSVVVVECQERAYKVNAFLDNLWYRGIYKRDDVWFADTYRDYEGIFLNNGFVLDASYLVDVKEVKVFIKKT